MPECHDESDYSRDERAQSGQHGETTDDPWNATHDRRFGVYELVAKTGTEAYLHTANDTISQTNNNANNAIKFTKLGLSYVAELAKGCISPRLACSAVEPTRPLNSVFKTEGKTGANSGSILLDAMSF